MARSLLNLIFALGPRLAAHEARRALREALYERDAWHHPRERSDAECVVIGGCGRSGTTLLREMLSRHPSIACGPESGVLCSFPNPKRLATTWDMERSEIERMIAGASSVVGFAERFFGEYARRQGKARWGDKTPGNVRQFGRLLALFPKGRFIHVLRDGRDVACSLRTHPRQTIRKGEVIERRISKPIEPGVRLWLKDAGAGLALRGHPRVIEVRYEDLVEEPERTCRAMCDFLEEEFHPAMLEGGASRGETGRLLNNPNAGDAVSPRSRERWRRDMSPDDRRRFHAIAGELLVAAGYAEDDSWIEVAPSGSDR